MKPGLHTKRDRVKRVVSAISILPDREVLVGVPASETDRHASGPTNAMLARIHDTGSPARNIPARPFMRPGISEASGRIQNYMRQAGQHALQGNRPAMERSLQAAGMTAASSIKAVISRGIPPPLKQGTVNARRTRSPGSSYRRNATQPGHVTPLVDTGQMRNAITYLIRRKPK